MNACIPALLLVILANQQTATSPPKSTATTTRSTQERLASIEYRLEIAMRSIEDLRDSIGSLQDETKRLRQDNELSLDRANQVVNEQNSLIDGFGTIYTYFTVCLAILTIGFPLLTFLLVIWPNKQDVDKAMIRLEDKLNEIDEHIEEPVKRLLRQHFQLAIDQAIAFLDGFDQHLREKGVQHLSTVFPGEFTEEQLWKVKYSLQQSRFSKDSTISLVKILLRTDKDTCKNDFFLNVSQYPHLSEDATIRHDTAFYLLRSELPQRFEALSQLITSMNNPTIAYEELIGWLSTDDKELAIDLINYEGLNNHQKIDRSKIIELLKGSPFKSHRDKVNQSYLFRTAQKKTKISGASER